MQKFTRKWLLLLTVLVLVASACGGDDEASSTTTGADDGGTATTTAADVTDTTVAATDTTVAGGSGEVADLRITWWGGETRHEATLAAIEVCKAENPNIAVVAEFQGWDGYWDKIATLTAAGNAPDVYQHNFGFFGEYVERNALLGLDDQPELDLTGWDESVTTQGVSDGHRYALPTGGNINTLLFDVDAVVAAGVDPTELSGDVTWDEFAALAKTVSDAGGDDFYAANDSGGVNDVFEIWLKQRGKQVFNDDGSLGFAAEDAAEYWEYWSGLRDAGSVPPIDLTAQIGNDLATHPLSVGQAAMQIGFSAQFGAYSEASGNDLGLAPVPNGGADADPGMSNVATGLMWAASADTQYPSEATTLINCLVNSADAVKTQNLVRGVPLSQASRDLLDVGDKDQQVVAYISEQATSGNVALDGVLYTNPPLGSGEVAQLFFEKYQEVGFGAASAIDAATSFVEEATVILAGS